jgi:hypothetical protein
MTEIPTPQQKREQLDSIDGPEAQAFLEKVVLAIKNSTKMTTIVGTQKVRRHAVNAVKEALEEQGWDVKYVSDHRDGDYLEISERS